MLVRDIMNPEFRWLTPTESILIAAINLSCVDVDFLPIAELCDGRPIPLGIVTVQDVIAAVARRVDVMDTVEFIMQPNYKSVGLGDSLEYALYEMTKNKISQLFVVSENSLVGILLLSDIFKKSDIPSDILVNAFRRIY